MFKSKISGIVIGGGTLIGPKFWDFNLFKEIIKSGLPVYVHGTGVYKFDYYSEGWLDVLGKDFYGGVRGPFSELNLENIKINSKVVGDAAFAVFNKESRPNYRDNEMSVLINLGAHTEFRKEKYSRGVIKEFIQHLIASGFDVQFLPLHQIDVKLGFDLKSAFPEIRVLDIPGSFTEGIKCFRSCAFGVGERLHFNVLAVLAGCPFLSVNYGSKHEDFLASLNLRQAGCAPEDISLQKLKTAFLNRTSFKWDEIFERVQEFSDMQHNEKDRFLSKVS